MNVFCFYHLQRYKPIIIVPTFSFNFIRSTAKPFHRSNGKEGSRSVAERFVVVSRTKPSLAHVQRSVVTYPVANIVTDDAPKLPAILAYHGQAYKHLKAETLNVDDLNYSQGRLWITSFLYGLLRPLDAILPYRMEGNVELPSGEGQNMFGFWKSRLTDVLIEAVKADGGTLIHLATEEYQHLFDWHRVRKEVRVVQPLFYVRKGSELKIQAVWAKTCRGAMTRFIIENRIDKPEDLCAFSYEGFTYEPKLGERLRVGERSSGMPDFPHFIKQ